MAKYIVKRVIMALITILVVACVTFVLMMSVPGSPFNDEKITPEQKAAMEAKYGMDDPLGVQMLRYLKGVIVDQDFGVSLKMQKDRPVLDIITEKFPLSAKIGVIALVWAVAVGIPLGCLAAYNRGKWVDSVLRVVCTLGVSMPGFVVATFLLMLFCNDGAPFKFMGINVIFDASQGAKAYLMPCLALGLYPMCYIARLTRSSMLDALGQDYIKTARAKGLLTPRIIFKHALRNAMLPVSTVIGLQFGSLLGGALLTETVFAWPGIGKFAVDCVLKSDFPVVQGIVLLVAVIFVIMNLVVDIVYAYLDPRIKYGAKEEG